MLQRIGIELTRHCNFHCRYCLRSDTGQQREFPFSLFERVIEEAKQTGARCLAFTGGEPTLHSRFADVVRATADSGMRYQLVTNGWNFLSTTTMLTRTLPHLLLISFSLDSADAGIHDAYRRKGSFFRVMQGISFCRLREIPFAFKTVVGRHNQSELVRLATLATRLGAVKIDFMPMLPTIRSIQAGMQPNTSEWMTILKNLRRLRGNPKVRFGPTFGFGNNPRRIECRSMRMEDVAVNFEGKVVLCCQLSGYGDGNSREIICNLNTTSLNKAMLLLRERWEKSRWFMMPRRFEEDQERTRVHPCLWCARELGKLDFRFRPFCAFPETGS